MKLLTCASIALAGLSLLSLASCKKDSSSKTESAAASSVAEPAVTASAVTAPDLSIFAAESADPPWKADIERLQAMAPQIKEATFSGQDGGVHMTCAQTCTITGRCVERDGKCVAVSAEACKQSYACGVLGRCSLQDDNCKAVTDSDCAGSEMCKKRGRCTARGGRCVVAESAASSSTPAK